MVNQPKALAESRIASDGGVTTSPGSVSIPGVSAAAARFTLAPGRGLQSAALAIVVVLAVRFAVILLGLPSVSPRAHR